MPRCHYIIALLLFVAPLGGCKRGPNAASMRADLEGRLSKHFGDLFRVGAFKRRGHYPYSEGEENRVLVYYSADLTLRRDHKLTDWDELNVGSLVSVLGAGPRGVKGVKAAGNSKDDVLQVNGAFAYRSGSGGPAWQSVAFRAETKGAKPLGEAHRVLPYRKELERIRSVGTRLQKRRVRDGVEALTQELSRVAAAAERRLGKAEGKLTIATGVPGGEYHRQGHALAEVLNKKKTPAAAYATAGSLDNCRLVAKGEVLFGYAQNDIAAMAFKGEGNHANHVPLARLRALCSLYPEAVQLVVASDSGISSLSDLKRRRVSLGPMGSGTRDNAIQVLSAAEVKLGDLASVKALSLGDAVKALREGELDALFFTGAFPNVELRRLAADKGVRIVDLGAPVIAALTARHSSLLPVTLPAKTYPQMAAPVHTVGVTAMLVARDDAADARVQKLLATLFGNIEAISRGSLQAYLIAESTALKGVSLPLHPAAKRFFGR